MTTNNEQQKQNNPFNLVGNISGDVKLTESVNKDGKPFKVANFSVVKRDENGKKVYTNCSAFNAKADQVKDFKSGDFVDIFGREETSMGKDGKEYKNMVVLSPKLLKSKESMRADREVDGTKAPEQPEEEKVAFEKANEPFNLVGNVSGNVEVIQGTGRDGKPFKAANFSVVKRDESGQKVYTRCAAYNDKADQVKDFKSGDFVNIFGREEASVGRDGKEYKNMVVLKGSMLKAKEKGQKKESLIGKIKKIDKSIKENYQKPEKTASKGLGQIL